MDSQQLNLDVIANNLANVNTTAYKRSKIEFQDLLYSNTRSAGAEQGGGNQLPTGAQIGQGSRMVSTSKLFTTGEMIKTGEKLDLAIQGDGFLQVQLPDGSFAYTRDGNLKQDGNGRVLTSDGLTVLSGFQPIPAGTTDITIASTGEVTMKGAGGASNFRLQLVRFNNPAGLQSMGGNIYKETSASGAPETGNPGENGFGEVAQYYLETSNVSVVEEMVNLIKAQRAYEVNAKAVQTSDEMMQLSNNLRR